MFTARSDDDFALLRFAGEVDIACLPQYQDAFENAFRDGRDVIVDLAEATLVDSIFLSELMRFQRRCGAEGRNIAVVVVLPTLLRMFAMTNLAQRLALVSSREAARDVLKRCATREK